MADSSQSRSGNVITGIKMLDCRPLQPGRVMRRAHWVGQAETSCHRHNQLQGAIEIGQMTNRDVYRFYLCSGSKHGANLLISIQQRAAAAFCLRWFRELANEMRLAAADRRAPQP